MVFHKVLMGVSVKNFMDYFVGCLKGLSAFLGLSYLGWIIFFGVFLTNLRKKTANPPCWRWPYQPMAVKWKSLSPS